MRIATVQFAPKLGDVEGNIKRAEKVLKNATIKAPGQESGVGVEEGKLDILVLPELAFTGYNFPSLEAIKPYLERAGQGPSATWARETAKQLGCKVCVGYPEIELPSSEDGGGQREKYYNSLLVVDENGDVLHNYRKAFLYYTDETWASEGSTELGFRKLTFKNPSSKSVLEDPSPVDNSGSRSGLGEEREIPTSFGICMDINPYRFEAPYTAFEFATRVLDSKSQLVILSMAWLTLLSREELDALRGKPELDTFNYWIQRFMPLIRKRIAYASNADVTNNNNTHTQGDHDESDKEREGEGDQERRIIIVFANRAGEEDGVPLARYAGTSAVIAVSQRPRALSANAEPRSSSGGSSDEDEEKPDFDVRILCWDVLGASSEGFCFADTTRDPEMVFQLVRAGGRG